MEDQAPGPTEIRFRDAPPVQLGWAKWGHYRIALYKWPNWLLRRIIGACDIELERFEEDPDGLG